MRSLSRGGRLLTVLLAGGLVYIIIVASAVTSAAPTADIQPSLPLRAAFYYAWFPGVWRQYGIYPYTVYHPTAGFYDSSNQAIIQEHLAAMQYGNIQVGISSWWGQGSTTDQ